MERYANVRKAKSAIHSFCDIDVLHIFIRDTIQTFVDRQGGRVCVCVFKTDAVRQAG